MTDKDLEKNDNPSAEQDARSPEILVNEYGTTRDSSVVVDEADRTVLLTSDDVLIIEKQPELEIVPKNRPRKVYAGMWGQAEIVSVGVGLLTVLTTILLYIFLVIPSDRELEHNRAERDRLERDLYTAREKYGNITSTETQVATLISSVNEFETRNLPIASVGKNTLYQRINGLIAAYGLVNTSGPDYSPLETVDQEGNRQSEDEKGRSKFRSIFPGTYVTMTVDGPYQNLRRFIAEIEKSNDFVVISSIELEPSDTESQQNPSVPTRVGPQVSNNPAGQSGFPGDQGGQMPVSAPVQQRRAPAGKTHGATVSLRIEMAAYFRRPNFVPMDSGSLQ